MMRDAPRAPAMMAITQRALLAVAVGCSGPLATAATPATPLLGEAVASPPVGGPGPDAGAASEGGKTGGGSFNSTALAKVLMKYAPSYVLMTLAISVGLFVVCRPAGFSLASLAKLAESKKPKPKQ